MERVQFEQEQMLDELKDLVDKGIFTIQETKEILKRRTAFETSLVRRVAKKADYLRYATYEMGLEELRRKRIQRLQIETKPATISSYSIVRRQFRIFERALKRFKDDVGLWIQYIDVARKEGAKSLVGRICARAIHLHPSTPALYILAAEHELSVSHSPSAARALLQRGVRLNKESVEMWREWVRMEMSFVEGLRRRWEVLGIQKGKGKQKAGISMGGTKRQSVVESNEEEVEADAKLSDAVEDQVYSDMAIDDVPPSERMESAAQMEVTANQVGDEGEAARQEILNGAIVKTVISSAAGALPKLSLFVEVLEVIETHPCDDGMKAGILNHMWDAMRESMGQEVGCVRMLAWRHVREECGADTWKRIVAAEEGVGCGAFVHSVELVEKVRRASEEWMASSKTLGREAVYPEYCRFVEEMCGFELDEYLVKYLVACKKIM